MSSGGTAHLVADVRVRVNGQQLPSAAHDDLVSVTAFEDLDAPAMFALKLVNWDAQQLRVSWSDSTLFKLGATVEVQMGYIDQLATILTGEVTGLEPEFNATSAPLVTVRGYDRSHRLMRGRRTRTFTEIKDSEIAQQLAKDAGLSVQAEDTRIKHPYLYQHNQTDYEFLLERAARINYELRVQNKTLSFKPPQNTKPATLTLDVGLDLLSFSARLSSVGQSPEVSVRGWDPKNKKAIVASASQQTSTMAGRAGGPASSRQAFGSASAGVVEQPIVSAAEAQQIADAQFNDSALRYVTAEATCPGRNDLHAGSVIKINGVGTRFSGDYYVVSVRHAFDGTNGFQTSFSARRNAA
jgi:Bacteriophage probable baseplate hub protein